jgi:hypothetical protein
MLPSVLLDCWRVRQARFDFWQMTLSAMLVLLIVVIPLYLAMQLATAKYPTRSLAARGAVGLMGWGLYIWLFWTFMKSVH